MSGKKVTQLLNPPGMFSELAEQYSVQPDKQTELPFCLISFIQPGIVFMLVNLLLGWGFLVQFLYLVNQSVAGLVNCFQYN